MTRATKFRDKSHARIYADWQSLPAWQHLSGTASKLLAAMLIEYRPGNNGCTDWSAERAGSAVGRHKATGARMLSELVEKGWIEPVRPGSFRAKAKPSRYSLTMYPNDAAAEPASNAFRQWAPYVPAAARQSQKRD